MARKTVFGNTSLAKFDVVVIGSGAGGGAVVEVLTRAGKKVLCIEAGPNWFDDLDDPAKQPTPRYSNDELKFEVRNFITPDPLVEPRTWRVHESDGDRTYIGDVQALPKNVGGGMVHADVKMPRFHPDDFHLGTSIGASVAGATFADWPVDYDALEPFYFYVEKALGIQGQKGANPFEGPRTTGGGDYPMPPGQPMYVATKIQAGAQKLGYTVFPYPTAVNSRPYDGRPPCVDCGFCSGFGCPNNAKGSTAVTMLRKALLSGNCQLVCETRVVKLVMNAAKNAVTSVECIGPDGAKVSYTADQYVLAASPIEDARLLLLSDLGGPGIGNSSGLVGRNLMFHIQTTAVGIFEELLHGHRGRTVTHGICDFRGKPNDPQHPLGGILEISGSEFPIGEAGYYATVMKGLLGGFDGRRLKSLMRQSPLRDHIVAFALQAEDAPQASNRVDLDPKVVDLDGLPVARITYANHAWELAAHDFYGPKILDLIQASGAKWGAIGPLDSIPASDHIMGTLRFGADPKTSVCDPGGKLHDVGNLWAADGCLFPTSSGYNPTHTLVTLATWVAGGMAFPGSPQRTLPPV